MVLFKPGQSYFCCAFEQEHTRAKTDPSVAAIASGKTRGHH